MNIKKTAQYIKTDECDLQGYAVHRLGDTESPNAVSYAPAFAHVGVPKESLNADPEMVVVALLCEGIVTLDEAECLTAEFIEDNDIMVTYNGGKKGSWEFLRLEFEAGEYTRA